MKDAGPIHQTVLILCKIALHTRFIKDILHTNYDILEVQNAAVCEEMVKAVPIDYLIIDERMIEDKSKDFLEKIQSYKKKKPFSTILMTRNLKKSFDEEMKKLGVDRLLREPIDEKTLIEVISKSNPKNKIKTKIGSLAKSIGFSLKNKNMDSKQRLFLNQEAQKKIRALLQEKGALTLLMIELDQYQQFIKQHGDQHREKIIELFEELIKSHCRPQDSFISLGSANCVILLPKTSKNVGEILAEEIRKNLQTTTFPIQKSTNFTVSIGIVEQKFHEDETKSLEEFKHSMDLALGYTILAKQTGNKICSQDS